WDRGVDGVALVACDGGGMIRGDDVDGCCGVVFVAAVGDGGQKPTGVAPEK
ncbi:hypothetical protein Tco_1424941, partial [Tanacetum coccineum]